ncbi:MAG: DUF2067 family protein [Thermofilaceae archaeon]
MKKIKKTITLNFKSSSEATEFLEHVVPFLGGGAAEIKGCFLKLVLMGTPDKLEENYTKIMEIAKQWRLSRRLPKQGLFRHNLGLILPSTKLVIGIPLTAIVDVLTLRGYQARLEKGYITTNASYSEVCEIAGALSEKYSEALPLQATPSLKKLVAVLAVVIDAEVKEVLERLKVLGLAREDTSTKCYTLASGYNEALQKVKAFLSTLRKDNREQKP